MAVASAAAACSRAPGDCSTVHKKVPGLPSRACPQPSDHVAFVASQEIPAELGKHTGRLPSVLVPFLQAACNIVCGSCSCRRKVQTAMMQHIMDSGCIARTIVQLGRDVCPVSVQCKCIAHPSGCHHHCLGRWKSPFVIPLWCWSPAAYLIHCRPPQAVPSAQTLPLALTGDRTAQNLLGRVWWISW